jgi:hypothetical protein
VIEPTGEMRLAFDEAPGAEKGCVCAVCLNRRLAAVLAIAERQLLAQAAEADRLVAYALHLRMHGERAPGGNETWRQFDRDAEAYLRARAGGTS